MIKDKIEKYELNKGEKIKQIQVNFLNLGQYLKSATHKISDSC